MILVLNKIFVATGIKTERLTSLGLGASKVMPMTKLGDFNSEIDAEFEELVVANQSSLYKFAFARLGNSFDAQDVVQETFLKAFRSFDQRKELSETRSWLRKILVNNINDFYRKKSKTVATVFLADSEVVDGIAIVDPAAEFDFDSTLQQALMSMSDQFAIPLLLREVDDATYEEISEILGIPIGTVMSRLSRARAQLRRKMLSSQQSTHASPLGNLAGGGIHNDLP